VRKLKEILFNNQFGTLQSIKSSRLGTGIIRDDVSVFGDLSSHDLAITNYLLDQTPIAVKAEIKFIEDDSTRKKAVMTVYYPNNVKAIFESSWYSSNKERKMTFYGKDKTLFYDDTLDVNKIKIVDNLFSNYPTYDTEEPISLLVSDLYKTLKENKPSLTDCNFGLDIISILEAAQFSLENNGNLIQLQTELNAELIELL
jgi:predicted dehydrogenase